MTKTNRVINDFGKKIYPATGVKLLRLYCLGILEGWSKARSVSYAMTAHETTCWHSGEVLLLPSMIVNPHKRRFWNGSTRIDTSVARFNRLMETACHGPVLSMTRKGMSQLAKDNCDIQACLDTIYRSMRKNDHPRIRGESVVRRLCSLGGKLSRDNVDKICQEMTLGKRSEKDSFGSYSAFIGLGAWNSYYKLFSCIRKGRDLFIKGLGTFDVSEAVDKFFTRDYYTRGSVVITCLGYKMPVSRLVDYKGRISWLENQNVIDWLIRNRDYYWVEGNLNTLDEIDFPRVAENSHLSISQATRVQYQWEDEAPSRDVAYERASLIPDKETDVGKISFVKNYGELEDSAKGLHNCARSYHPELAAQTSMMAVCTDEGGKPLAMAEIMTDANGPILGQVAGPCNQDVSKEIQEAFVNVVQGLLSR